MQKTFYVRPAAGERIETDVTLAPDLRSALFGRVTDPEGKSVPGALVMLFEAGDGSGSPEPYACQYSDEDGHFLVGPLEAGRLYCVKVYKNSVKLRQLEIVGE